MSRSLQAAVYDRVVFQNVMLMLQSIDEWSFDVFAVNAASEGNALKFVGYELLQKYDLISKFKVRTTAQILVASPGATSLLYLERRR